MALTKSMICRRQSRNATIAISNRLFCKMRVTAKSPDPYLSKDRSVLLLRSGRDRNAQLIDCFVAADLLDARERAHWDEAVPRVSRVSS